MTIQAASLSDAGIPDLTPVVADLIARKAESEHGPAGSLVPDRVGADVAALHAALAEARSATALPLRPTSYDAPHDLVVRTRPATA